ncbi:conserved protein of unknown function [Acidithiobacillus ferrivorans]|uniref:FAD dependent oxidoreductase domain-containing protein n=1 Tax=Acidithiobacillus ferrivorans TaxID=160808 RepID=A0A060UPI9_9PROT|nr:FAD-dependent oxidoreductase [Acidithiobacillus ferrivorans]CDQ10360.1 conserved hypothetical protein [Acidithiobacillus ferrivorans]SMH64387.1 conserved protein of unknown function [Acidithiobacillus ferrivorans]
MPGETSAQTDVLLIGGGAIGLLSAIKLAEAGLRVTVLDQGHIGQEASWAGGGILSPLYPWHYPPALLRLALYSMQRYFSLTATLLEQTGIDPEWIPSGLLIMEGEQEKIPYDVLAWGVAWGLNWRLGHSEGAQTLWCPEVAQVRNPRLLAAMAARCRQLDIVLHENTAVTGFRKRGERLQGVETTTGFIPAELVIVTAGAWSRKLLDETGSHLDVIPVRGQMLLLQSKPGTLDTILMRDNHYLIPRRDGLILAGSTSELAGFDKSTTDEARNELLDFATQVYPDLERVPILKQWSGLRPGSQDSIPYIGPVPGWEGLFVAAGHFRYGLTNAPATADILVSLLMKTPPPLDIDPYAVLTPRPAQ